jgi:hypothetical protein
VPELGPPDVLQDDDGMLRLIVDEELLKIGTARGQNHLKDE